MGFRALTYDTFLAGTERAGLRAIREELLAEASGRVIEVGAGTGLNLALYGPAVDDLTMTEPDPAMLRRLEGRAKAAERALTVLRAPAEDLPFEDAAFDMAVSTLVLCTVPDQPRAVRELRRVLRPGGRLLFIEHLRSDEARLAHRQDRMNWISRLVGGCDCNRPTLDTMARAGFVLDDVEHGVLPKSPSFVSPMVVGRATAPAHALDDRH